MGLFASLFGSRRRRRARDGGDSAWLYAGSTNPGNGPPRSAQDDNPRGHDSPGSNTSGGHQGHHSGHHGHDHSGHSHSDSSSSHDSGSSGGGDGGGGGGGD